MSNPSSGWRVVVQLYHEALERRDSERAAFLDEVCGADEALRRDVESLLAQSARHQELPPVDTVETAVRSGPPRDPLIGFRLGSYEIASLLGSGGMGDVYRARDTKLGRDVAIKLLPKAFTADSDRRVRFEREARLLAALNHPHIGAIYGLEETGGLHALVLELVEGQTLAARTKAGALPVRDVLTIARQIADALEAAHERGIVHRDLKPANIILQSSADTTPTERRASVDSRRPISDDVSVKVVDFGLAKMGSESVHDQSHSPTITVGMTGEGIILGTAAYMSPEQARGRIVDKRTDIWAFGCVIYELLTGQRTFAGDTVSDTIAAILGREPDWALLPDSTPAPLRRLLRRCLEKDLRRRLHDIADARIDLEDAWSEPEGSPVGVGSVGRAGITTKMSLMGAAGVIVLVAFGAAAGLMWRRSPEPSGQSLLARVTIAVPSTQTLDKGRYPPLALSPDGKLLVFAAAADGGRTSLYLRPLNELTARRLPATEGASTPFFSPDGRWLAFYQGGLLKKVSVEGGVPLTICDAPPVWSASWGERDAIVFATTLASSGLWLVSANGGEPSQITTLKPDEVQHGYPQLLPGGAQVLFSVRRRNAWLLSLLTLEGRKQQLLGNGRVVGEAAQYLPTGHVVYAQAGGLVVTPFDPAKPVLDQPPVPLLERVETSRFGGAYFAVAAGAGTLAYIPAATTVPDRALLRVDGEGRAAPLASARAAYEHPSFSPDAKRIAVTIASETGSDVWIIDLDRATRTRFTTDGTSAFPVWSGDGSKLAFQSTAPGPWNLFWKPIDASSDAQPLLPTDAPPTPSWPNAAESLLPGTLPRLSGAGPQFPSSWAPDSTLAFHERKPGGERDIWVVSPGKDPVPFLLTPFDERTPRFSPDGRWLAYVSDESGRHDVYVQPFPGPGPKSLVSTDGGTDPVWSRDGRALFYRHDDDMMSVAVTPKGELSIGRPQRLFEIRSASGDNGPSYDVSPDGKWFVMLRGEVRRDAPELHVVFNWFREVTSRTQGATSGRLREPLQLLAALRRAR